MSTEREDRGGDVIRVSGWDFADFKRHPVLLAGHNYRDLRATIGEWTKMEVQGKKLVGVAQYYVGRGNPDADWGWELAKEGKAAYSVGFIPDMAKAKERESSSGRGGFFRPAMEFNGQQLLEVSQVNIPANADARQRMKAMDDLDPVIETLLGEFDDPEPILSISDDAAMQLGPPDVGTAELPTAEAPDPQVVELGELIAALHRHLALHHEQANRELTEPRGLTVADDDQGRAIASVDFNLDEDITEVALGR